MESDEFQTPTPPEISDSAIKIQQVEVVVPVVPLKRKTSVDSPLDGTSLSSSVQYTQRALLARTAPHLFDGNGHSINSHQSIVSSASSSSASSPTNLANNSRSPSLSARPSPNPSDDEGGDVSDRGTSFGPGSSQGDNRSRHVVPKGFRGPLPRLYDPEDVAPLPTLIPIANSSLFNTLNYPYSRNGYNYIAAGPSSDQLPTSVYKTLMTEPRGIHWSWSDRSPFTHISQDATILSSDRGFRSARANVPIREGQWYVEVHVLSPEASAIDFVHQTLKDGPHVRLGWGRREAGLNAPVGINGYSYGIRDTTGEKVFLSRTYPYGKAFGPGDVIGMYISLPKARKVNAKDPMDPARINRKRIPIRYKGRLYFEAMEYAMSKEMEHLMDRSRRGEKLKECQNGEEVINASTGLLIQPQIEEIVNIVAKKKKRKNAPGPTADAPSQKDNLRPLPTLGSESQIGFFINGEPQGIAFDNLLDFRPLRRRQGISGAGKMSTMKNANTSSLGLSAGEDANDASIITTTSSLASILKSRENFYDDGSLGYFPFVSLFGGAKVKLVSRADEFRYPPPANVRLALEEADRLRGIDRARSKSTAAHLEAYGEENSKVDDLCRPIEERYGIYLAELWQHDLADEEKAKETAHLLQANAEQREDDDNDIVLEQKPIIARPASKKSRKRNTPSSRNESPQTASTPLQDDQPSSNNINGASSNMRIEIKQDEMTGMEEDSINVAATTKQEDTEESLDTTMGDDWITKVEQLIPEDEERMQIDLTN